MAKTMARIENGFVTNIEWYSDSAKENETFVNIKDISVTIGYSYTDGKFYDFDGNEVLTPLEMAQKLIAEYEAALSEIEATLGV